MPKKKIKKVNLRPAGFKLSKEKWNDDIHWKVPNGFSFRNSLQSVTMGSWNVDFIGFQADQESKDTIVVLLGPLESMQVYKHLVHSMIENHNILFLALPGFGMNMNVDLSDQDIDLRSFAQFVAKFLEGQALDGHQVHLLGSSAAASVALETSLICPARVTSLMMNGLTHKPSKIWQLLLKEVVHRLDSDDYLDCADAALLYLVSDEILGKGRAWGVFRQYFRSKLSSLTGIQKQCLKTIVTLILKGDGLNEDNLKNTPQCPVLAFTGEYDHLSAPYDHAHFIDTCINGIFATIEDADHLIHVERPRVIGKMIHAFINKTNIDDVNGVRTYPPQSYVTLDRRRDPRYVTSRPKISLTTDEVIVPDDWEDAIPKKLSAKLRNINFSGCLIQLYDERFQIKEHAGDLKIYLPKIDTWLDILAFEQANQSLRCLFLHENYESAMAFKEMLEYGEHFVDADLELDEFEPEKPRDMPWLGAKRQGSGFY